MPTEYPLSWPDNMPRTLKQVNSQFRTSLAGALKNVSQSLATFSKDSGKKLDSILISSNVTLGKQMPSDAGVAVYFTWDGISTCIAVDRYTKVEDNLQAIHHVIEAKRTILRHGGIELIKAAFRGYAALPPPGGASSRAWWDVLGVPKGQSFAVIKEAYMRARSKAHPDKGGSDEMYDEVQRAWEEANLYHKENQP